MLLDKRADQWFSGLQSYPQAIAVTDVVKLGVSDSNHVAVVEGPAFVGQKANIVYATPMLAANVLDGHIVLVNVQNSVVGGNQFVGYDDFVGAAASDVYTGVGIRESKDTLVAAESFYVQFRFVETASRG